MTEGQEQINQSSSNADADCAVCLQKCHHPTKLPCGHIFCFLCVKGVAIQNKKCAMCRAEIPSDYLDHPDILEKLTEVNTEEANNGYQWYYEGRNGWWKYEERSNEELEEAFNSGATDCTLLLAGSLYLIDFQSMIQRRCNDQTRRRRIRRDTPALPAKGIAGIKIINSPNEPKAEPTDGSTEDSEHPEPEREDGTNDQDVAPQDRLEEIIEVMSSINLDNSGDS